MPAEGLLDHYQTTPGMGFGVPGYGTPVNLSVIVSGVSYALDDGTFCYWVGDDGLGMSPLHRLSERGPLQHGDTDKGYRLDPRMVRLVLEIIQTSQEDYENARLALLSIFKPSNTPMVLKFEMESGTYCLDCHCYAPFTMPSIERMGWNQTLVVDLVANDPTFYDPAGDSHVFAIGAGPDTMLVPTVMPMTIGGAAIDATESVVNEGTVSAFPRFRITGPITDPIITNNSTGEILDFTGTTIAAAHYYDIDLRYGYKTVIDNHGVNQIATLSDDSDLVSWHLGADPDVPLGINAVQLTGTGCLASTSINLSWFNRYIGI